MAPQIPQGAAADLEAWLPKLLCSDKSQSLQASRLHLAGMMRRAARELEGERIKAATQEHF